MKKTGTLFLVILGFVSGIAFVYSCGGGSGSSAATVTRYYAVNPANLHPFIDGYDYQIDGVTLETSTGSNVAFVDGINLPQGAEVQKISVFFYDLDAVQNATFRMNRADYQGGWEVLHNTIITTGNSGWVNLDDVPTASRGIIDNSQYNYFVSVTLGSPDTAFLGAIIEYTETI